MELSERERVLRSENHISVRACVCMRVCTSASMHSCKCEGELMSICAYICIHVRAYKGTCIRAYVCTDSPLGMRVCIYAIVCASVRTHISSSWYTLPCTPIHTLALAGECTLD